MRFIGLLFLALVITFGLTALGYWMRILHELLIQNKLTKAQINLITFVAALGFMGIIAALTGLFLL